MEPDDSFGQSDSDVSDSGFGSGWRFPFDIPDASIGITMVSPPESPLDELPNDRCTALPDDQEIFHTPPLYRSTSNSSAFYDCNDDGMIGGGLNHDGKTGSAGSRRAVDLRRDTNSGCSEEEVDSAKKIKSNSNPDGTFHMESEGIRVSKGGSSPKGQLSTESPFKTLKSLDFELPSEPLGTDLKERNTDEVLKSLKKWNFSNVLELENQQNRESNVEDGEGGVRKRRLDFSIQMISSESEERNTVSENNSVEVSIKGKSFDFSTEGIECDTEKRNVECENDNGEGNSGRNTNILEDIDRVRYAAGNGSNSCGMEEKTNKKGELPSCSYERAGDDERYDELDVNERETVISDTDSDSLNEDFMEITVLDVLVKLEKDSKKDRNLACLSLLEVAERKWGTFSSDK